MLRSGLCGDGADGDGGGGGGQERKGSAGEGVKDACG